MDSECLFTRVPGLSFWMGVLLPPQAAVASFLCVIVNGSNAAIVSCEISSFLCKKVSSSADLGHVEAASGLPACPKVSSLLSTLFFIKYEGQRIRVNFRSKKCPSLCVACYLHYWELTRLRLPNTKGLEHRSECADQSLQCS